MLAVCYCIIRAIMAGNITNVQRKWVLKQYCGRVREKLREELHTLPSSTLSIYRLRDKFDLTGSIYNAPKTGRPKTVNIKDTSYKMSIEPYTNQK